MKFYCQIRFDRFGMKKKNSYPLRASSSISHGNPLRALATKGGENSDLPHGPFLVIQRLLPELASFSPSRIGYNQPEAFVR
jgi:hypothetical protein